jgi:hypothetical protein
MFAARKSLKKKKKHVYGMVMACSQHINHKKAIQANDHSIFAAR